MKTQITPKFKHLFSVRPCLLQNIVFQSIISLLSNVAYKQTDKQMNLTESITFFAKEVIIKGRRGNFER